MPARIENEGEHRLSSMNEELDKKGGAKKERNGRINRLIGLEISPPEGKVVVTLQAPNIGQGQRRDN